MLYSPIVVLYICQYGVFKDVNLERSESINLYPIPKCHIKNNLSKIDKADNVEGRD